MPVQFIRLSGALLAVGGLLNAVFLVLNEGHVSGAEHIVSPRWSVAHNLHWLAAHLLLVGVVGLYAAHAERAGRFGVLAFLVALTGTGLFVATGMITGVMWPVLGRHAPALVEPTGPFLQPPHPALIAQFVVFALGYILLAAAIARSRPHPRPRALATCMAIGGVLQGLPTAPAGPTPNAVIVTGGLLFAVGTVGFGLELLGLRRPAVAPRLAPSR